MLGALVPRATRVTDVLPQIRPSGSSLRTMIAAGSVTGRPSPSASLSQSPQASAMVAAGSPEGRWAANFGPKRAAFRLADVSTVAAVAGAAVAASDVAFVVALAVAWIGGGGERWPGLVRTWVPGGRASRAAVMPSQVSRSAPVGSAQTR